jgi:hypothetical protein
MISALEVVEKIATVGDKKKKRMKDLFHLMTS